MNVTDSDREDSYVVNLQDVVYVNLGNKRIAYRPMEFLGICNGKNQNDVDSMCLFVFKAAGP